MKTRELQTLWWDWLSTAERLLRTLGDQTRALVQRDVTAIDQIQPELDTMLTHMKDIDHRAATTAVKLAEGFGVKPDLRSLADVLPSAEAQQLTGLANRVTVVARNVQDTIDKNRTLIASELTYVQGTLALIAKAVQETESSYAASNPRSAVLMDQVA